MELLLVFDAVIRDRLDCNIVFNPRTRFLGPRVALDVSCSLPPGRRTWALGHFFGRLSSIKMTEVFVIMGRQAELDNPHSELLLLRARNCLTLPLPKRICS